MVPPPTLPFARVSVLAPCFSLSVSASFLLLPNSESHLFSISLSFPFSLCFFSIVLCFCLVCFPLREQRTVAQSTQALLAATGCVMPLHPLVCGTGTLSPDELQAAVNSVGIYIYDDEVSDLVAKYDVNGDGALGTSTAKTR